jgi:four helix bundle protein
MRRKIESHQSLLVYQKAFSAAMDLFRTSKTFPKEETYSLTDQMRRASRSVCANQAEAWRKRRYEGASISKLSDAEGESAETQVWIQFAVECRYLDAERARTLYSTYDEVQRLIVCMIVHPENWIIAYRNS